MKDQYEDVKEFMRAFGQKIPETKTMLNRNEQLLRYSLCDEEANELIDSTNLASYLDAVIDLLYVTLGAAAAAGISNDDLIKAWDEVHSSNMSKFWTDDDIKTVPPGFSITKVCNNKNIVRDDGGKVRKPAGYKKADLTFIAK